ncbi:MAG: MFS transporter [Chloroflexi bacterium]|nr:MFS transporter [Chloroflexota bacterium]
MTTTQQAFLRQRPYQAVSLTHFFVDILNSSRNLLVALLAIEIGLTNAQVGIALLLYNIGGSLSQPLFGWLADRIGARWLVVGGMGWMIFFFGLAAVAGNWAALAALTIAGVGSGMFHPSGTMVASQTSQTAAGKATSIFFFTGQFGLFLGPILAGILLTGYGRPGYIILPTLALTAFVFGWQHLTTEATHHHPKGTTNAADKVIPALNWPDMIRQGMPLVIIILAGSTASIAAMTFGPKLFSEMGYTPARVGVLSGLWMLGSAVGGILGGALADRVAGKWIIIVGMAWQILPIYFYIPAPPVWQLILLFTAGFFGGMPHTILVLSVLSLFPGRQAMASGLALGLMFTGGAIGSYIVGLAADEIGLAQVLQMTAVLPIIAVITAFFLPKTRIRQGG